MINARKRYILRATVGYAVIAALWILLSDQLLSVFTDVSAIAWLSMVKGLSFVLVTAWFLFFVLHKVPGQDTMITSGAGPAAASPETVLAFSAIASRMPRWLFYVFGVALTAAMLLVRSGLGVSFGERPLLILFLFPVILSALLGGLGPGLVSTMVAAAGTAYFFIPPVHHFLQAAPHDKFQWGMLIANGVMVSILSEAMRLSLGRTQELSQHLNAVVAGTSDAVFVKDLKGRYQLFNEGAARLVNRPADEIIGHDDRAIFAADVAAGLLTLDRSIMKGGKTQTHEESLTTIGGRELILLVTKGPVFDRQGHVCGLFGISRDITERKQAEREREDTLELLRLCNGSRSVRDLVQKLVSYFLKISGCSAVGVRLRQGEDFPYYETRGFSDDFVRAENSFCSFDTKGTLVRDSKADPAFDCMCGNVLRGRFDPAKPFFGPGGSFWSSDITELPAATTDTDRKAKTQNRCNGEGYASVALLPLRAHGEILGLVQFNDKRKGRFTAEKTALLEDRVNYVAIALAKLRADEARSDSEERYRILFEASRDAIMTAAPPTWKFTAGNLACIRLFHARDEKEFVACGPSDLSPAVQPDGANSEQKSQEMIDIAMRTGSHFFEWQHKRITGEEFPATVLLTRVVLKDETFFQATVRDITEQKRINAERELYQRQLELLLETAGEGIFGVNRDGQITFVNQAAVRLIGLPREELIGRGSHAVFHVHRRDGADYPWHDCPLCKTLGDGIARSGEETYFTKDGSGFPVEFTCSAIVEGGVTSGAVMMFRDITDRRKIEGELRQAQKLEGVGQLAGGIAHDFNNVLSAVVGFAGLLKMKMDRSDPLVHYADEIMAAGQRGAALTQQILAFSRKQVLDMRPVRLNEVVQSIEKMLQRLVREDIDIHYDLADKDLVIFADVSQIDQILINLVTNARDAMPRGGRLGISTESFVMDRAYVEMHGYGSPGDYAVMSIADTGSGMDAGTRSRIFEPFFTTKESGRGTGLGLAVVHGIVKQHNGYINVYSEVGKGTNFRVLSAGHRERDRKRKGKTERSGHRRNGNDINSGGRCVPQNAFQNNTGPRRLQRGRGC